ncbi:hypothetical protein TcG_07572 [Trypanosoma cruzi]|nr:hypothetical protein TcG_07572 [Trypanosoma cruzi]
MRDGGQLARCRADCLFLRHAQTYGRCLATSPQTHRRTWGPRLCHARFASCSLRGAISCRSEAETASEMRGLLHLLEKEKKRNVLFESQGRCIRALRLMEEANAPSLRASR